MIHNTHLGKKTAVKISTGNHRAKIIICIIMQNPWKLNFELLKQTSKSISERFFFPLVISMAPKKNLESLWGIESQTFRFTTLMIYYWVTETLLWAQLLQGPHVRCILQSRIGNVESISKGKSKSIVLTSCIWLILPV